MCKHHSIGQMARSAVGGLNFTWSFTDLWILYLSTLLLVIELCNALVAGLIDFDDHVSSHRS